MSNVKGNFSINDEIAIILNRYMSETEAGDFCGEIGSSSLKKAVFARENRALPKMNHYKL